MNNIYYESYGQGQPVVLLHSGGMAGEEWQPQIEQLSARYRVLLPDLPGHGKSPLSAAALTIEVMGRAVIEMLDQEGIGQSNICGSSMGGAVALWLTLHYPERIKRLVIYRMGYRTNTQLYAQTQMMANPQYWQQFKLQAWLSRLHMPQGGADAWKTVITRVSNALHPETSQHCHDLQALANIRCPVLLIVGDRDPVAPLADMLAMYQTIADAGLWIMPFADHITGSNTWRSSIMAEELRRFFSR